MLSSTVFESVMSGSAMSGSVMSPDQLIAATHPRPLAAVIMAAGEGTRMRSARPKPIHRLCGRPMVLHVLDAAVTLDLDRAVVVVGHEADRVTKALIEEAPAGVRLEFVTQHVQRGTGDAVSVALTAFPNEELDDPDDGDLLVLPGDQPLFRPSTLQALVDAHRQSKAAATVLTARVADPTGLGRVVRGKSNRVQRIVEHRDASPEQLTIDEINTSVDVFQRSLLAPALRRLSPENSQGEYYLTDVIEVLYEAGYLTASFVVGDVAEAQGVNDRVQLAAAEAELRRRTNERLLREGVTMLDPERTYVEASVRIGADVTLFPGTMLQGSCVIGSGAEIGPDTRLIDTVVGEGARVEHTVARRAEVGAGAQVGPFASLESGARIGPGTVTGPFFRSAAETHDTPITEER